MADNLHVAIRVRPLITREAGFKSHWKYDKKSICLNDHAKPYIFDRVFAHNEETADVYREIAQPIVQAAMSGYDGTIFAYGQTSSGKTYTMQGTDKEPGIITRAMKELFEIIENTPEREFLFRVSYMELYNEVITDLLVGEDKERVQLSIRENESKRIFVNGLHEEVVTDPEAVFAVMKRGNARRHIGKTNMNEYSSRSHTIFKMTIESCGKETDEETNRDLAVKVSELNLVDLAGSERANETKADGVRLKEAGNINRSLFTLCNVISRLSARSDFIPFRDSKLTRILQSALGGNSKTAVICTVTPVSIEQTDSTLQFASRAKTIQTKPEINEILTGEAQIQRCQKEIKTLKEQLEFYQQGQPVQDQDRIARLEEEKMAQQQKINELQSMILVSKAKPEESLAVKKKRRMTWCPGKMKRRFSRLGMLDDSLVKLNPLPELEELRGLEVMSLPNESFRIADDYSFSSIAEPPEDYSPVTKRSKVVTWDTESVASSSTATQTDPPEERGGEGDETEKEKQLQETLAICDQLVQEKEKMKEQMLTSNQELMSQRQVISSLEFEKLELATANQNLKHRMEDLQSTREFEVDERMILEEFQNELTEKVSGLEKDLQQALQSRAEVEIQLGADKGRLEKRVVELTTQLQEVYGNQSEASKEEESEAVKENQRLTQVIVEMEGALQAAKEELEQGLGAKEEEFRRLVEERLTDQSRLVTLEEELNAMKSKLEVAEQEHRMRLDEVETAKEQLSAELDTKEQEWKDRNAEHETDQRKLGALEGELTEARTKLEMREKEYMQQLGEISAAKEGEVDAMRLKLDSVEQELRMELEEVEMAKEQLMTELDAKDQECKAKTAEHEIDQQKLEALKRELAEARTDLERHDGELKQQISAANEKLGTDLADAELVYKERFDKAELRNRERVEALEVSLGEAKEGLASKEVELETRITELETVRRRLVEVEDLLCQEREGKNVEIRASEAVPSAIMEEKVQELESSFEETRRQKAKLEDFESRNGELQKRLEEVETEKLMLEAAREANEQETLGCIEKLEMQKRELEENLAEAERKLAAQEQELLELQQSNKDTDRRSEMEDFESSAVVSGMSLSQDPFSAGAGGDDQQRQLEVYRAMVVQNEEQKTELASKVLELQEQQEEAQRQHELVASLRAEVAEVRRELQEKEEELRTQDSKDPNKLLDDSKGEQMQSVLAEARKEFEGREQELEKRIEDLCAERRELQTQTGDLERQRDELQELAEGNEKEMESWRTEADEQRRRLLASLESAVAENKAEFEAKERDYRERIQSLELEKSQLQELVTRNEAEMESHRRRIEDLERISDEGQTVLGFEVREREYREKIESLEGEKARQQESVESIEAEMESYRRKVEDLEGRENEIQADVGFEVKEHEYQEMVEGLEREKSEMQESIKRTEAEMESYRQKVGDLEMKIEELRGEKEETAGILDIKEQELEIALQQANEMEQQMTELMAERDRINNDLQESINCSIEAQEELLKTQGALEEALQNLQSVEEKYDASMDDNEHLTSSIACLQDEKSDLERALADSQQAQSELSEHNENRQRELAERNGELEEELRLSEQQKRERGELAEENEQLENRLKDLTEELRGLQESGTTTASDVQSELSDRITSLQRERADLEKKVDSLEQKLQEHLQDLQNNQRDIDELTERNTELELQLEELKESSEEQREKYELAARNDQLQHNNTTTVLQQENADLQQDVANLEQELQEHLREKEETQKQLDELIENNMDLENQLKEMTEEQERTKETSVGHLEELTATIARLEKEKSDLQQAGLALEQGLDELSGGNAASEKRVDELSTKNTKLEEELSELRQSSTSGAERLNNLEKEKTAIEKKLQKIEKNAKMRFELLMKNAKQAQSLYVETLEKLEKTEELLAERDRKICELEQRIQSLAQSGEQKGTVAALRSRIAELTQSHNSLEKELKSSEEKATETFQQLMKKAHRAQELYVGELEAREKAEKIIEEEKKKNTEAMEQLSQRKTPVIDTANMTTLSPEELRDLVRDLQVELASNQRQIKQLDRIMEEASDPSAMGFGSGVVASATASHLRAHNRHLEKHNVEVEKQLKRAQELLKKERFKYTEMKQKKEYWKGQFSKAKLSHSSRSTVMSPLKKPLKDHNTPTLQPASVRTHPERDDLPSTSLERSDGEPSTSAASLTSDTKMENKPVPAKCKWLAEEFSDLDDHTSDNCQQQ